MTLSSTDGTTFDGLKDHPRVCNTCFRLQQHEDPLPDRIERLAQRALWASALSPMWTRTMFVGHAAPTVSGRTVSDRIPTTVCECGEVSTFGSPRWGRNNPLDMDAAIDYAKHLSATLSALSTEAGRDGNELAEARLAHDRDVLLYAVGQLKQKPELQFKDELIFAAATEVACRRAGSATDERPGPIRDEDDGTDT